jgi:hypothetical protein
MTDEKTYTKEEMEKIVEQQVLMSNISGFFNIALANGGNWGMTRGMIAAGQYCYQLIMTPAPQKKEPEKVPTDTTPNE